jgi:FixJ family two-component response regulator
MIELVISLSAQAAGGASGPAAAAATPHTIVLVEDDDGLRSALVRVLELAGYRVESFATAEDVLAAGAAARAACIVCDVYLPRESGFALCRRLSQAGSQVPVIFITAHDLPAVRAEAEALGAADCLIKPFAGRRLVAVVRAALTSA